MEDFDKFLNSTDLNELKNKYPNFNEYFDNNELKIIFNEMDKNDYRHCGQPRWIDLACIIDSIYIKKTKNNYNKLKRMYIKMILESYPPQNIYVYEFE